MKKQDLQFNPSGWWRNSHLQSCYGAVFSSTAKTFLHWEEVLLPDGDFIDVAWAGDAKDPVVVMLHGLEGSVQSNYIQYLLDPIVSLGFQVAVMHYRSCSGRLNRLAKGYHAGDNGDFAYFMQCLSQRFLHQKFIVIGFSLGGSVLLNYLAANPLAPVRAGLAVSVPFELKKCAHVTPTVYRWNLLSSMKQKMWRKAMLGINLPINPQSIKSIQSLYEFDEKLTAPLNNFESALDYYEQVSPRNFLHQITHPVLLIHALDDPLIPYECIPSDSELPENISLELTTYGGHVGFIQGSLLRPEFWLKTRVINFLHHLKH